MAVGLHVHTDVTQQEHCRSLGHRPPTVRAKLLYLKQLRPQGILNAKLAIRGNASRHSGRFHGSRVTGTGRSCPIPLLHKLGSQTCWCREISVESVWIEFIEQPTIVHNTGIHMGVHTCRPSEEFSSWRRKSQSQHGTMCPSSWECIYVLAMMYIVCSVY